MQAGRLFSFSPDDERPDAVAGHSQELVVVESTIQKKSRVCTDQGGCQCPAQAGAGASRRQSSTYYRIELPLHPQDAAGQASRTRGRCW